MFSPAVPVAAVAIEFGSAPPGDARRGPGAVLRTGDEAADLRLHAAGSGGCHRGAGRHALCGGDRSCWCGRRRCWPPARSTRSSISGSETMRNLLSIAAGSCSAVSGAAVVPDGDRVSAGLPAGGRRECGPKPTLGLAAWWNGTLQTEFDTWLHPAHRTARNPRPHGQPDQFQLVSRTPQAQRYAGADGTRRIPL